MRARVCALVVVAWSSHALADDATTATKLFEEGRALREANKVDEACTKFEQSLKLDQQLGTVLNLADCREAQGRRVEAYQLFVQGAELAAKTDKKVRETYARGKLDALKAKLGRVTLRVADPTQNQLTIKLGGKALAKSEWGVQQIVEPGKLVVSVSAFNFQEQELSKDVPAGAEVTLDVPALNPLVITTVPPVRNDKDKAVAKPSRSKTPFIIGATGLGLVIGSAVLGLSAKSSYDAAVDENGPDLVARIDGAQRRADIATGLMIGGAVAVGVGVVLYVRDGRRVVVAPTTQGDRVGVRLSTAF